MIKKACGFLCLTAAILSQAFGADDDTPADHHHTSHLFAVYPGCQISPGLTPALAGAAKVSLDARGIDPGSDVREWSFACAGGELKRAAIRSLKGRPCQVRCGDTVVDLNPRRPNPPPKRPTPIIPPAAAVAAITACSPWDRGQR